MSTNEKRKRTDRVECDSAKRGIWLVKVPRYLSDIWDRNDGKSVGQLLIKPVNGKTDLIFKSSPDLDGQEVEQGSSSAQEMNDVAGAQTSTRGLSAKSKVRNFTVPREHSFIIGDIRNQSMAVLCEDKMGLNEDASICSGRLSIEGRVVKRADCRPPQTADYLRMKIKQIEKCSQPKRHVKQMEKAEVKFKPIAMHAEMIAREKQKKEGAKMVRADKDTVRQSIFHAFEKHQYYRLIDLQKLTNQPPSFVKEILTEIANYNTMPPHKSMWELKPEYRSYAARNESDK